MEYAEKNEEIKYEFEIKNASNTDLDNLVWIDYLPHDKTKITRIMTGTYNENVNYLIYYKTNKSDYKLFKEATGFKNEYLDLDFIELTSGEKIVEIKIEYKNVSKKFASKEAPNLFVKINNNVKKDAEIINNTELTGVKDGYITKDTDISKTIIKEKEVAKKLPKTGC